jgi:undecaprenyl diphosphate synthase
MQTSSYIRYPDHPANSKIPYHVAIIMDGNGRWAEQRSLPRPVGHREGVKSVRRIVRACYDRRVKVLTLFAFSSENWQRPPKEVNLLMELFLTTLRTEIRRLNDNNVRLRVIGERSAFPEKLQFYINQAEALTADNTAMTLVVAANYSGRWDIVQATRQLAEAVQAGEMAPEAVQFEHLQARLCLADLPEPDLFIRTGGEQRISNFLLWQMAYTELFFTDTYWPDYDADCFDEALNAYARRQRRYGLTGTQVEEYQQLGA